MVEFEGAGTFLDLEESREVSGVEGGAGADEGHEVVVLQLLHVVVEAGGAELEVGVGVGGVVTLCTKGELVLPIPPLLHAPVEDERVPIVFGGGGAAGFGDGNVAGGTAVAVAVAGGEDVAILGAAFAAAVVGVGVVGENGFDTATALGVLLAVARLGVGEGAEGAVERASETTSRSHGDNDK